MAELINSFREYYLTAKYESWSFWLITVGSLALLWLFTVIGLKLFRQSRTKPIYFIHKVWIISSLAISALIIATICYFWSTSMFSEQPLQFPLILSLILSLTLMVVAFISLRSFYTKEKLRYINNTPKSNLQLEYSVGVTKRNYSKLKLYLIIPFLGFLLMLVSLYKGTNLITFVFDNSGSMVQTNAIEALNETVSTLEENNEIVLTTLNSEAYLPNNNAKRSISEVLATKKSNQLVAGLITMFHNPEEASSAISGIQGFECCSPVCESIWKTYLYINEVKRNFAYSNRLLIIVSDGEDNYVGGTLTNNRFFFDDEGFSNFFPPDKVFVIDYSVGSNNSFMMQFAKAGVETFPADNSKDAYLEALSSALKAFKKDVNIIYWTLLFTLLFTVIALLIPPKTIV